MTPTLRRVLSTSLLGLLVATIVVPLVLWHAEIWRLFTSREALKAWMDGWGALAPLVYVAAQAFQVVIFAVPGEIVQIAGGWLFGAPVGALLAAAGTVVGATICFFAARLLGRPFVNAFVAPERIARVEKLLSSRNARTVFFLLYLIPGIPKDVLGYVAGLSPLSFVFFITVSTLGRLPGLVGSAVMGSAVAANQWVLFGIVGGAAVLLFTAGLLLRPRIQAWLDRLSDRARRGDTGNPGGPPTGS